MLHSKQSQKFFMHSSIDEIILLILSFNLNKFCSSRSKCPEKNVHFVINFEMNQLMQSFRYEKFMTHWKLEEIFKMFTKFGMNS
jgi:hypothetical protein